MVTRHLSSYVVRIPKANIYRFGDSNKAGPVLAGVDWTVREGESWAVVGSGAGEKTALLEVRVIAAVHCPLRDASRYTDPTRTHADISTSSWWTLSNPIAEIASH